MDSIALASLCQALAESRPELRLQFKAFIVDHRARDGSDLEALKVTSILQSFGTSFVLLPMTDVPADMPSSGLSSTIVKAKWPEAVDPRATNAFETYARRVRFEALARACLREDVTSLFLAHHADDQAETVLARLASGHSIDGLGGLRRVAGIPENFGLHRVYESGRPRPAPPSPPAPRPSQKRPDESFRWASFLEMEGGGVNIYRPLLPYSKERLVATCKAHRRSWIEDPTNQDVTLTARNAIRVLLKGDRLPKALRRSSLLALAERINTKLARRTQQTTGLLHLYRRHIDTRVGVVSLRLPSAISKPLGLAVLTNGARRSILVAGSVAEELVVRVARTVSPSGTALHRSQAAKVVPYLFPSLALGATGDMTDEQQIGEENTAGAEADLGQPTRARTSLLKEGRRRKMEEESAVNLGQVLFKHVPRRLEGRERDDAIQQGLDADHVWTVFRQPCDDRHMRYSPLIFPSNRNPRDEAWTGSVGVGDGATLAPVFGRRNRSEEDDDDNERSRQNLQDGRYSNRVRSSRPPKSWSSWHLWDGRYWIRLRNDTGHDLHVRVFTELDRLYLGKSKQYRAKLAELLKVVAPGNIRWTLPVISLSLPDGGLPLALPSLTFADDGPVASSSPSLTFVDDFPLAPSSLVSGDDDDDDDVGSALDGAIGNAVGDAVGSNAAGNARDEDNDFSWQIRFKKVDVS